MPLLQCRLYHLLEPIQLLHTLHHHGVSLLQHIQSMYQSGIDITLERVNYGIA